MKMPSTMFSQRKGRGSIAVEMAILLPLMLLLLAMPLFFARVFWYYSVGQKAAHDAARFLSSATAIEMRTQATGGGSDAPVATLARAIVDAELDEIKPVLDTWYVEVQCDLGGCGVSVPQTVRVRVRLRVRDNIFGGLTDDLYMVDGDGLLLTSDVTMRYVGN